MNIGFVLFVTGIFLGNTPDHNASESPENQKSDREQNPTIELTASNPNSQMKDKIESPVNQTDDIDQKSTQYRDRCSNNC